MVSKDKNILNFEESQKKRAAKQKQHRKSNERKEKEAKAEANRIKFGRTGAQKKQDKKRAVDAAFQHEQHRLRPATSDTKQSHKTSDIRPTIVPFTPPKATTPKGHPSKDSDK
ncbi:MAG: hypothetical protein ACJAVO_002551 [Parvibaculaceae bacterium]|jgi:hypothetical protein